MTASAAAESFDDGFLLARFRAFYARLSDLRQRVRQGGWSDPASSFGLASRHAEGGSIADTAAAENRESNPEGRQPEGLEDSPLAGGARALSAEAVARELQALLERDALEAARLGGGYGAGLYREAQYLMAALADEMFLSELEWQDRDAWQRMLLEHRLFNSSVAGERIFRRIDQVLAERDPVLKRS